MSMSKKNYRRAQLESFSESINSSEVDTQSPQRSGMHLGRHEKEKTKQNAAPRDDEEGEEAGIVSCCCCQNPGGSVVAARSSFSLKNYRVRCFFKSRTALVILFWNVVAWGVASSVRDWLVRTFVGSLGASEEVSQNMGMAMSGVFHTLIPLGGFLADVYLGRYRTIIGSMWAMWVGLILGGVIYSLKASEIGIDSTNNNGNGASTSDESEDNTPLIILSLVAFPLVFSGWACFTANILQFTTDQMQGFSSDSLTSFVHWWYWTKGLGEFISHSLVELSMLLDSGGGRYSYLFVDVALVTGLSLVLVLHYCFMQKWFVTEPIGARPYKTFSGVLKFAWKHKNPVRRSAFTYWEDQLPSRIDLGKEKYGGPYTNEQVEDVKTVLRLIGLLAVLTVSAVGFMPNLSVTGSFIAHLGGSVGNGTESEMERELDSVKNMIVVSGWPYGTVTVVFVPVLELVVVPLFRRCWTPKMLPTIGFGLVLSLSSTICYFVMETVAHGQTPYPVSCMLSTPTDDFLKLSGHRLELSPYYALITIILTYLGLVIVEMTTLEFVLAQTPYSMKGVLIGMVFSFLWGLPYSIWLLMKLPFVHFYKTETFSCGSAYFLMNSIYGVSGLIFFISVACVYRYRQRDDIIHTYKFVEQYYSKLQSQER